MNSRAKTETAFEILGNATETMTVVIEVTKEIAVRTKHSLF